MRVVNFILAIMFLGFAFLQLNDPDPARWILIYGVMAVFCIAAMFEVYARKAILAVMIIYGIYSVFYINGVTEWLQQEDLSVLFDDVAKMEYIYIEESREFLGLIICIIVLAFYLYRSGKRGK